MTEVSFSTTAQPNPGGVLLIEIPETVVKKLGAGKRVPVRVTLNGAKYRSTIAVYGDRYYLPARKEIRDAAKLVPGGRARVSLEVDLAPRTVEVPADLAQALTTAKVRPAFDGFFLLAPQGVRRIGDLGETTGDPRHADSEDRRASTREGEGRLVQG